MANIGTLIAQIKLDTAMLATGQGQAVRMMRDMSQQMEVHTKKSANTFEEMSDRISNRIKFLATQAIAMFAVYQTGATIVGGFRRALKAVDDYKTDVASLAAVTMTFMEMKPGETAAEGWQRAHTYAEKMIPVLEQIAARTLMSGRETTMLATELAKAGVFLDANNKKQVEGFEAFSNALAIMTKGQGMERQILTEVKAVFGQGAVAGALMIRMLKTIDPQIEGHIKLWQKEGTVMEHMAELLRGFSFATGELAVTWQAVKTTIGTTFDQILRGGSIDVYDKIMKGILSINDYLNEHKVILQEGVMKAWGVIETLVTAAWKATTLLVDITVRFKNELIAVAAVIATIKFTSMLAQLPALIAGVSKFRDALFGVSAVSGLATMSAGAAGSVGLLARAFAFLISPAGLAVITIGAITYALLSMESATERAEKRYVEFAQSLQGMSVENMRMELAFLEKEIEATTEALQELAGMKMQLSFLDKALDFVGLGSGKVGVINKMYGDLSETLKGLVKQYRAVTDAMKTFEAPKGKGGEDDAKAKAKATEDWILKLNLLNPELNKLDQAILKIEHDWKRAKDEGLVALNVLNQWKNAAIVAATAEFYKTGFDDFIKQQDDIRKAYEKTQGMMFGLSQKTQDDIDKDIRQSIKQRTSFEIDMANMAADAGLDERMDTIKDQEKLYKDMYDHFLISNEEYLNKMKAFANEELDARLEVLDKRTQATYRALLAEQDDENTLLLRKEKINNELTKLYEDYLNNRAKLTRENVSKLIDIEREMPKTFAAGWSEGIDEFTRDMEDGFKRGKAFAEDFKNAGVEAIEEMIDGNKKAFDNFDKFLWNWLKRQIALFIMNPIMVEMKGIFSGSGSGGIGNFLDNILGGKKTDTEGWEWYDKGAPAPSIGGGVFDFIKKIAPFAAILTGAISLISGLFKDKFSAQFRLTDAALTGPEKAWGKTAGKMPFIDVIGDLEKSGADTKLEEMLQGIYDTMKQGVLDLGMVWDDAKIMYKEFEIKSEDPAEIEKAFLDFMGSMVQMASGIDFAKFSKAGETIGETVIALVTAMTQAQALKVMDLQSLYADMNVEGVSPLENLKKLAGDIKQGLRDLVGLTGTEWRSKVEQIGALTAQMYQAQIDYLMYIKGLAESMHQGILNLKESMMLDTLGREEKIDYYNKKLNETYAEMLTTADPTKLQELYDKAIGYMEAGWGLMTEEEKTKYLDQATAWLDELDSLIGDKLKSAIDEQQSVVDNLSTQLSLLNDAFANLTSAVNGAAVALSNATGAEITPVEAVGVPQYAGGIDYINQPHLGYLHKKEAVITGYGNEGIRQILEELKSIKENGGDIHIYGDGAAMKWEIVQLGAEMGANKGKYKTMKTLRRRGIKR